MYYPASNALKNNDSYWLSKRNVEHDHWEAVFSVPQKLDVIEIKWRLQPKEFRVFIKLDDNSDFIAVTEMYTMSSFVTPEGKIQEQSAISEYSAVVFNKPVFAKSIRINLNNPLKKA